MEKVVLCWPVCLEHERYERNALIFALGFVHGREGDDFVHKQWALGVVLQKACAQLAELEIEGSLLSDATREGDLAHLLSQVLRGLREHGTCSVAADAGNTLQLQVPPRRRHTSDTPIVDGMVPVLVAAYEIDEVRRWDLAIQKLLRWIDGTRTVAELATAAKADLALVRAGLEQLQTCGWVRLIDGFDEGHAYACTPKLHVLANDPIAREQLVSAVKARDAPTPPTWGDVLRLYGAMRPGFSHETPGWRLVSDLRKLHPEQCRRVDLRALVYAGVLNDLIERVKHYPVQES